MYSGDPSHSSYAPAETAINPGNVSQLQQLWKTNVGAPIASAVTTDRGSLFFGAWDGYLYSVDAGTGIVLWKAFLGRAAPPAEDDCQPAVGITAQPVVDGNVVYAGGGDSSVYALDRDSGAVKWRTPLADPQSGSYLWSSPVLYKGALFIGIASLGDCPLVRGGLARIPVDDPSHPLVRYFVPDGNLGAGVWSTPAIDQQNDLVYVTTGNADMQDAAKGMWGSAVLVMDQATLTIRSHFFKPAALFDPDSDWGSSPTLLQTADGRQYLAANGKDGVMYVLNRPDLSLAWRYKVATLGDDPMGGEGSLSTPAFDGQTIFTGAGQTDALHSAPGNVYAIDPQTHNARWTYPARGVVLPAVTVTPYLVLVPTDTGLSILDAAGGAELWNDQGTVGMYGQAVISQGTIYAAYINGDLAAWALPDLGGIAGTLSVSPGSLLFSFTLGGPRPAPQSIKIFSAADELTFTVSSDSSWLSADLDQGVTPLGLTLQADPTGLSPGSYPGTLTVTSIDGSSSTAIAASLSISGSPSLGAASIVSAATFQPVPLAPGGLFTVMADNLAADTMTAGTLPWPTFLNGVSVTINGHAAHLLYVSPTQINAQAPFDIPPGAATLVVNQNGVASPPVPVGIAATSPSIFVAGAHAAALNQDSSVNSAQTPADTGSVISVYFTGQGLVDNPVSAGAPASATFLNTTRAPTAASIGGQPAEVLYSGLAPGYVGLAQANLRVPDLPSGDYPLTLTIGSNVSNPAVISIRH